jgi:murein DD-endopeptidase MepM/ murein hydrolase activator NlpD
MKTASLVFGFILVVGHPALFAEDLVAPQIELFYPQVSDQAQNALLEVKDGSVLFLKITGEEPLAVFFETKKLVPFPLETPKTFGVLVAIPPETKPANLKIEIQFKREKILKEFREFKVVSKAYPTENLSVAPAKGSPNKKDLVRILAEQKEIGKIYKTRSIPRLWKGALLKPMESVFTSVFGNRRMFNGITQSFHSGLDFKAPEGTPVLSAAAGKVLLAKDLFFSGHTVILDHGYGLFTLYAHLSKFSVKPGDQVNLKGLLGLSGKTGRVSGPHLHWGAVVGSVKVDPLDLTSDALAGKGF